MRNRWNLILLTFVAALTVFSIFVVWPGWPKRYLPDFVDWPQGQGLHIGGLERKAMRLGLDLKGGTYVLLEADVSKLPSGTNADQALEGAKRIIERRVNAFGVSETEISREGKNRLAVQLPGISPEQARQLIGRTALLEFRQPVLNESRQMACQAPDGSQFSVPVSQFNVAESGEHRIAQCSGPQGETGELLWEPASGIDSQGQSRVMTGRFLRPTT